MANNHEDWKALRDWEFKECLEKDPMYPVAQSQAGTLEEWRQLSKKIEQIQCLSAVRESLDDARKGRSNVTSSRRVAEENRFGRSAANQMRAQQDSTSSLHALLAALRTCMEDLRSFNGLQLETNNRGWLNSSERLREHTTSLMKEVAGDIKRAEAELGECRKNCES